MINLSTLKTIKERHEEVQSLMSQPEVATDPNKMMELGREHSELSQVVTVIAEYEQLLQEREDTAKMLETETDEEMLELARVELESIDSRLPQVEDVLSYKLIPKDPADSKNAIVEIRAGTGGDEAALFAGDLFRLYSHFAEDRGWKVEVIDIS